jgi:uncharacterized protein HemX
MDQQDNNSPQAPSQNPTRPVMDIQAPAPAAASLPQEPQEQAPAPEVNKPLQSPKKGKTPFGVMFVAILVGLALCGFTVFAYLKTKDSPTVKENQQAATQQKATAKDVDETTKGVDESLKSLDDSKDFNDADLSDSNLGL